MSALHALKGAASSTFIVFFARVLFRGQEVRAREQFGTWFQLGPTDVQALAADVQQRGFPIGALPFSASRLDGALNQETKLISLLRGAGNFLAMGEHVE